jgi:polyphosphate kinase
MNKPNYINRELSWINFNLRVLEEAQCTTNPPLERLKFLAITGSNLDEFFMVRVGSLTVVSRSSPDRTDIVGWTAAEQLVYIRQAIQDFYQTQYQCFRELEETLANYGIVRIRPADLNDKQTSELETYFNNEILSVIAPISISRSADFPMFAGTRLCICVRLKNDPQSRLPTLEEVPEDETDDRFVVIPLGKKLRRFVAVTSNERYSYMLLEDVIGMFLPKIFGEDSVFEWSPFRITRNADITLDEDAVADLLSGMQRMLEERAKLGCVRLEFSDATSDEMRSFLQETIEAADETVYTAEGPLDYSAFFELATLPGFKSLKDTPWPPQPSPDFPPGQDLFEIIAEKDRMLYHPYQSYDPVVKFVRSAAEDENVIAIKQTLYRTSRDSEIAKALIKAAENGKHVTVVVELKARFDEARNIQWARQMELAGVDVIYGVKGLKTHAKLCIVVRREATGIRRYVHLATGNYNESTANLYSDVSYFTCDEKVGLDTVHLFNAITGLSVPQPFDRISAAPINLRETLLDLIRVETNNARSGNAAEITAKLNSLVDKEIIDALYEASQSGVSIRLNIRGICCLRPGVPGLSENITVISVIDRLLEHARIFNFRHDGDYRLFLSSADWMVRNLNSRVELMVPVEAKDCKSRLIHILESYFQDNVKARLLLPNGTYEQVQRAKGQPPFRSQQQLYDEACELFAAHANPRTTVFKPHRGESA